MKNLLLRLWKNLHLPKNIQISIMRLFQDKFLVGVSGVIFNEKDEILLFKHTYRQTFWGLPSGFLKAREYPITGLEREIEEESGFIVSIDEKLRVQIDREFSFLDICYIGTIIGGDFHKSPEVSDYGFYTIENLPLLPRNQLLIINKAFQQRNKKLKSKVYSVSDRPSPRFLSRIQHYFTS